LWKLFDEGVNPLPTVVPPLTYTKLRLRKMNKYEHLEMIDTPHVPELAIYAQQVKNLTEQSIQIKNLTSLLQDCLEFVPSDLRRKIENATRT
jgi:hypothetical protein